VIPGGLSNPPPSATRPDQGAERQMIPSTLLKLAGHSHLGEVGQNVAKRDVQTEAELVRIMKLAVLEEPHVAELILEELDHCGENGRGPTYGLTSRPPFAASPNVLSERRLSASWLPHSTCASGSVCGASAGRNRPVQIRSELRRPAAAPETPGRSPPPPPESQEAGSPHLPSPNAAYLQSDALP
jgi:hypothetical protein